MNDKNVIDLEENKIYKEQTTKEWMAVDLGYRGLQHEYPRVAFPYPDNTVKLSEKEVKFNAEFKNIWIIVENAIMYIKKWKVCWYIYKS